MSGQNQNLCEYQLTRELADECHPNGFRIVAVCMRTNSVPANAFINKAIFSYNKSNTWDGNGNDEYIQIVCLRRKSAVRVQPWIEHKNFP